MRDARYAVIEQLAPGLLPPTEGRVAPLPGAPDAHDVAADPADGDYLRVGAPGLHVSREAGDVLLTHDGRTRRLVPFGRGIWRDRAGPDDDGGWRPHAGSRHVCFGAAEPDADGTRVVHLNGIPYVRRAAST